jgi:galactokinase/mevalonate kinase-like predicted kinase
MSTSSRKKAIELWQTDIPQGNEEKNAKTLFCFENPPGTKYVSGSQDSLGIVMPGLNFFKYDNDYWPYEIKSNTDKHIIKWLEERIWLVPLYPRHATYDVLSDTSITLEKVKNLSVSAQNLWTAISNLNADEVGKAMVESFNAQIAMFPRMVNDDILKQIDIYKSSVLGWKVSGAGGGGYLIFFSESEVKNAIQIRIRC